MLSNSFLTDMRTNLENMKTIQQQMTSGKLFSKPSDDPFKVARSMQLNTEITGNKQYNSNISDTINWLDTTDTALKQGGNVLQRVRELMVSAGNGAYSEDERQKIKDEINQLVGQFSQVLNTNFDGKYVFGGTRGTTKPTTTSTDAKGNTQLIYNYTKDTSGVITPAQSEQDANISSKLKTEISQGVYMDYNESSVDIIKYGTGVNDDLRSLFNRIINHLDGNNDNGTATDANATSYITGKDLTDLDSAINNLLKIRSEVGAKQNRMESAQAQNKQQNESLTEILSNNEDIDITEKTMEYSTMQTVYLASLQTSAKVLQPSLIDYL